MDASLEQEAASHQIPTTLLTASKYHNYLGLEIPTLIEYHFTFFALFYIQLSLETFWLSCDTEMNSRVNDISQYFRLLHYNC